MANKNKDL